MPMILNANAQPFEMMMMAPVAELSQQDLYELECVDDWVELQAELNVMEMEMLRQLIFHQQNKAMQSTLALNNGKHHIKSSPAKMKMAPKMPQHRRESKHGYGKKQGFPIFQPQ